MSLWSRVVNVFRGERLNREIDEELRSHLEEAVEEGRDLEEARRAFGPVLRRREESRDVRLMAWLDSLRADAVFGWRRLRKSKVTSAAAILSLALAIGSCTAAFRLIDALLLRPLPVAEPGRLYVLQREGFGANGNTNAWDTWAYPSFQLMRAAVKGHAELLAITAAERTDLTYASDQETEKAYVQNVSGWMFGAFGLRPALGRLLSENDDLKPGAHPVAVLSHDYWTRRFGDDPKVLGRTFQMAGTLYQIVGVTEEKFTGTEPGTVTDVFIPTMMRAIVLRPDANWFRTWVRVNPGEDVEPVRQRLAAASLAFEAERAKGFAGMTKEKMGRILKEKVSCVPAAAGVSTLQKDYRRSLIALAVLVALVLLIASANVANLMTAQAAARMREMALRLSIGAGRWRLIQLVLVESAWVATLAALVGACFAWWAAPFVVGMINPSDNPARLAMPADWRVFGFGVALTVAVTFLFGLVPALRASGIKPASALKGGDDPHARHRMMNALIALQVAFCFMVLFVAGLFVTTFDRLSHVATGFSSERLLLLDTVASRSQPPVFWDQVGEHLRRVPGVETVAASSWPLLAGIQSNNHVAVNGQVPTEVLAYFLNVSPNWIETMKIPLIDGRDFIASDTDPGAAIVNETFVKQYFNGENPVGKYFEKSYGHGRFQIVGVARNALYLELREPAKAVAYVPMHSLDEKGAMRPLSRATFIVRSSGANPLALASILRAEVPRARPEFRVSNVRTQTDLNESHMIRERVLAMLAFFFGLVALVIAGIGLHGVLEYSVLQRRREIGIRMAIGAQASGIARLVTMEVFTMVLAGAVVGLGLGMASVRYIETLFYQVKATDLGSLLVPAVAILVAAMVASLPAVVHAVRIDPIETLRTE